MSVRKRAWTTPKGEAKSSWVVDYTDTAGKRRLKTFPRKKEADAFAATAHVEVREGTHVADSASATVSTAGALWLKRCEQNGLERTTLLQYDQLLRLHIATELGTTLLSRLTVPMVRQFEDKLLETGRSAALVRKILVALGSLLSDAQERGLVVRNVVREKSRTRQRGTDRRREKRAKGKLKVGVDIPSAGEIKALVGALEGRWRPLFLTAIFTGLRASELRGLRWSDVDLDRRTIRVHQRADAFNDIGRPKSAAGERTVPVPPIVVAALKEWRLACPRPSGEEVRADQLVFPNGRGNVESYANIAQRGYAPAQIAAGLTTESDERDDEGKPILVAKYPGLHALRHFYASWCINRKEDGGLGLPPKMVQERLGHSSITLTMDTYGHLFPTGDQADELAAAETALLG
ncbi:tyrosine-type recombinase/integrase [Antarcticirhabdus aurantiaca]|uniref:Site-specific integrase n=1 Tax=Antarcticirhabdus aurantiaca TaxID=2606717 RepID=A0ACD4NW96_9HYPH|nr:site-specific integrase [Jeongeuplla avenae]